MMCTNVSDTPREAPSGKDGNPGQSLLSVPSVQVEEQGTVLGEKNQRKEDGVEKRFCFCFALGAKINLFPHLASWTYQEVVNTASRMEKKVGRQSAATD